MAAAKRNGGNMAWKEKPLKGGGEDGVDYLEFISQLCRGEITATRLRDTTVQSGPPHTVRQKRFDQQGRETGEVEITYRRRRLTKLEYDE
jgi:hypothetical protein